MRIAYEAQAIEDIEYWRKTDGEIYRRIKRLIESIATDPYEGIGKPEKLKGDPAGRYSRRITQEHRLVYYIMGTTVTIITAARHHYD